MIKRLLNVNQRMFLRRYVLGPLIIIINFLIIPIYLILPKRLWSLDRPIFIIGCPRSGTTMFVNTFKKHLDLADWSEAGQIIQLKYYDPNADHLMEEKDGNFFDSARIMIFLKVFILLKGRPRFVNKNPRNSLRIKYLKAFYPDALFVHLVRDGRAVVYSNLTQSHKDLFRRKLPFGGFCKPPEWRVYLQESSLCSLFAYQWKGIIKYVRSTAVDRLNPSNFLEVKYEDFCSKPHEVLSHVDKFCGLDPKRRDYVTIPERFDSRNFKWKQNLNESQITEITQVISDLLVFYDYSDG